MAQIVCGCAQDTLEFEVKHVITRYQVWYTHESRIIRIISTLPDNIPENFTNPPTLPPQTIRPRNSITKFPINAQTHTHSETKTHMYASYAIVGVRRERQMKGSTSYNEHCLVQYACACHSSMAWHAMPYHTNWYGTHIVECNAITVFKWSSRVHTLHFGRCAPFTSGSISFAHSTHPLTLCVLPYSSSLSIHLRIKLTPFHIHFHSTLSHHRFQTPVCHSPLFQFYTQTCPHTQYI